MLEYPAAASPGGAPDWCFGAPASPPHVPRAPIDEVRERVLGTWFGSWSPASLLYQLTPPRPRADDVEEDNLREPASEAGADRYERLLEEIHEMIEDYEAGVYVDLDKFSRSLDGWFSNHFRDPCARPSPTREL